MTYENETQLYIAYGSNMNHGQMRMRCPNATFIGTARLLGWQLVFRNVADIERTQKGTVPVALWLTTSECRHALDRYEGAPSFYDREYGQRKLPIDMIQYKMLSYEVDGDLVQQEHYSIQEQIQFATLPRFTYQMTEGYRHRYKEPSYDYYQCIVQGYTDCGLEDKHSLTMTAAAAAMRDTMDSDAKAHWFEYLHGDKI